MVFDIVVEKPQLVSLINWTVTFLHCFLGFFFSFPPSFRFDGYFEFQSFNFETLVRGLKFYNALLTFCGIDGGIEDAILQRTIYSAPESILISTDTWNCLASFKAALQKPTGAKTDLILNFILFFGKKKKKEIK